MFSWCMDMQMVRMNVNVDVSADDELYRTVCSIVKQVLGWAVGRGGSAPVDCRTFPGIVARFMLPKTT